MKAVCIIGSPNEYGNTAFVVDQIIDGMIETDIKVERLALGKMEINYCQGCKICDTTRRCVQRDDMDALIKTIEDADILLVASPSYWGNVSGQLKVFFDRCLPLFDPRSGQTRFPQGKAGIAVAVSASADATESANVIKAIERFFGYLGITPIQRITIEGVYAKEDFVGKEERLDEAFRIGLNLVKQLDFRN
ncbi:MAG TPA: hypothetical protein GX391_04195 [Firmicutes bacterium]|jgi:multimeric flavodoxin WrbA|nr:hypothetical protein [Bacillota bacterium]HOQ24745.1 flavodoxin family protein [Bacillota bacterium]HPT67440.1 flavodoxin family protein [Bacillota bacterium]